MKERQEGKEIKLLKRQAKAGVCRLLLIILTASYLEYDTQPVERENSVTSPAEPRYPSSHPLPLLLR